MYKRTIKRSITLVVIVFFASFSAAEVKAMTINEMQALISQLQTQILQLQQQLAVKNKTWCHNFNVNLNIYLNYLDKGEEVIALQTALFKEGLLAENKITGNFDKNTVSAVVNFKNKYKKEILTSPGSLRANSSVGENTRAKLNKLYGCSKTAVSNSTQSTGIILAKTNSNVEKVANEIANKRNWVFVSVETSNPLEIKNKIKETIKNNPSIGYLLIIGTDEQIPLKDQWGYIKYEGSEVYGFGEGAVLDSLFYGNIDEDIFVELGVGRIPFNNESDVRNYFNNFTIGGSKNYYVYYPVYDQISEEEKSPAVCLSKEFSNTNVFSTPQKKDLLNFFNDARILTMHTHGGPGVWSLKDDTFEKNDVPNLYKTRPLIISDSCLTAQELGPEFIKKGAGAFFGEYFVTGSFGVERSLVLSKKIFSGNSLGSALKDYFNYGIVMGTVNKKFEYSSTEGPIAVMNVNNLVVADHAVILFGDPSITIQPLVSSLNKTTLEKKNNKLFIEITKPIIETIDDAYVVGCYGGDYETNKKGWIKEHWNLVINLVATLKWSISTFIFPVKDISSIKSGKEIISGKEFKFETVRLPFVSLVKGNEEQYIAIEETITVDPSVFFNPREIILDF